MAHAREPITTILSLVAVASACFVVAKATWPVLLATFVVACFGLCLYKLAEKEVHSAASKARRAKNAAAQNVADAKAYSTSSKRAVGRIYQASTMQNNQVRFDRAARTYL